MGKTAAITKMHSEEMLGVDSKAQFERNSSYCSYSAESTGSSEMAVRVSTCTAIIIAKRV